MNVMVIHARHTGALVILHHWLYVLWKKCCVVVCLLLNCLQLLQAWHTLMKYKYISNTLHEDLICYNPFVPTIFLRCNYIFY